MATKKMPAREIRIVSDYTCDLCGKQQWAATWETVVGEGQDAVLCIDCAQRLFSIVDVARRSFKS